MDRQHLPRDQTYPFSYIWVCETGQYSFTAFEIIRSIPSGEVL